MLEMIEFYHSTCKLNIACNPKVDIVNSTRFLIVCETIEDNLSKKKLFDPTYELYDPYTYLTFLLYMDITFHRRFSRISESKILIQALVLSDEKKCS